MRLARYSVELRLDLPDAAAATPYRAALADELARHAEVLARSLAHVATVADEEEGHRARIEAKRLRYLLEPVAGRLAGAKRAVAHLKQLQDLLGELHDLQVLAVEVADAVAQTESERARRLAAAALAGRVGEAPEPRADSRRSERPGLLALAHRVAARRDEIFANFEKEWLGEAAPARRALEAEIRDLRARLSPDEPTPDASPAP
ncbi:MAG: CHAD domain-containing protein [Acidobacteria bacterium]|nr:CHAD domain-containing protein [Acidobacteriota bacterium]